MRQNIQVQTVHKYLQVILKPDAKSVPNSPYFYGQSEGTTETEAAKTKGTEKELRESTEKEETLHCHKGRHERMNKYKESNKNIAARYAGYSLPDWCPTLYGNCNSKSYPITEE